MSNINWMDWCQKQLSDVSNRLFQQGYTQEHIEHLNRVAPEFQARFDRFMHDINDVINEMMARPDSFSHYDAFTAIKRDFLEYTNWKRGLYLGLELAETA